MSVTTKITLFNYSWEQHKLGEILKTVSIDICDNPQEIGRWEVIQQGFAPIAGYSDDNPFENYKDIVLFGDHTLSIYKPKSPFLVASDGIKPYYAPNVGGLFLSYLLSNNLPNNEGYKRYSSILKDKDVFITFNKDEQVKISLLFDSFVINKKLLSVE